jgi:hypothetical protein
MSKPMSSIVPTVLVALTIAGVASVAARQGQQPPAGQTAAPQPQAAARGLSPEQQALQSAMAIADAAERLAALRKLQTDIPGVTKTTVDTAVLLVLASDWPDRRQEIGAAFDRMLTNVPASAAPDVRLRTIQPIVSTLLDHNVVIDAAEKTLADAVGQLNGDTLTVAQRDLRARGLEALGRIHLARGDAARAENEFTEALGVTPTLAKAHVALAGIEATRGHDAAALDHYVAAAVGGRLTSAETDAMHAFYRKTHGSDAGLEAAIDKAYTEKFPNPVKPEEYTPTPARSDRVVLLEMFTGSGCPPCVAADLGFDGVLERYPEGTIAPLAYHEHIPQADPMVTSGGATRRAYYPITAVPTFNVDGALAKRGGGGRTGGPGVYASYVGTIDKALETPAQAAISLRATPDGSHVKVTATVTKLPADAKDLRLHVVLAERELRFMGENSIRFHPMVVRAMAGPDGSGLPLAAAGGTVEYTFDLAAIPEDITRSLADEIAKRRKADVPARDYLAEGHAYTAIDPAALVVVAFVQAADKHVLQAATAAVPAGATVR